MTYHQSFTHTAAARRRRTRKEARPNHETHDKRVAVPPDNSVHRRFMRAPCRCVVCCGGGPSRPALRRGRFRARRRSPVFHRRAMPLPLGWGQLRHAGRAGRRRPARGRCGRALRAQLQRAHADPANLSRIRQRRSRRGPHAGFPGFAGHGRRASAVARLCRFGRLALPAGGKRRPSENGFARPVPCRRPVENA